MFTQYKQHEMKDHFVKDRLPFYPPPELRVHPSENSLGSMLSQHLAGLSSSQPLTMTRGRYSNAAEVSLSKI